MPYLSLHSSRAGNRPEIALTSHDDRGVGAVWWFHHCERNATWGTGCDARGEQYLSPFPSQTASVARAYLARADAMVQTRDGYQFSDLYPRKAHQFGSAFFFVNNLHFSVSVTSLFLHLLIFLSMRPPRLAVWGSLEKQPN